MLDKYQEIQESFSAGEKKFSRELKDFSDAIYEIESHVKEVLVDFKNVNVIIRDIDKQFEEKTGVVNPKDMTFLWGAVAVQCARWIMIPTFDIDTLTPTTEDRKDSDSEGKKDKS